MQKIKKKKKKKVGKVRVELKTIGIVAVTRNCYATRSMQFEWQTDPFIWIASGQTYP